VRANDEAEGLARIRASLGGYGLSPAGLEWRIVPVVGDLSRPRFGLSAEAFDRLVRGTGAVYHNGAVVNLAHTYAQLAGPNVRGTEEVLRFATRARAPVHFVSTISALAGAGEGPAIWLEKPLDASPESVPTDGYSQSKWVAEHLVAAAGRRGVPVVVYRPGRITGHSRTGASNPDDLLYRVLAGCVRLGAVPALDVLADMTPVDYVSQALVFLSRRPESIGQVFHLANPAPINLRQLPPLCARLGYNLRLVPFSEWSRAAAADAELAPLIPALAELTRPDGGSRLARYDCRKAVGALACGSSIRCPEVGPALLDTYLADLARRNRIPARAPRALTAAG
jgi:thioester reductase-like protein